MALKNFIFFQFHKEVEVRFVFLSLLHLKFQDKFFFIKKHPYQNWTKPDELSMNLNLLISYHSSLFSFLSFSDKIVIVMRSDSLSVLMKKSK